METSDLDPVSPVLGRLYLEQGHLEDAETVFRTVLQRNPGDREAADGLDAVRSARGRLVAEAPRRSVGEVAVASAERLERLHSFLGRIEAARRRWHAE